MLATWNKPNPKQKKCTKHLAHTMYDVHSNHILLCRMERSPMNRNFEHTFSQQDQGEL